MRIEFPRLKDVQEKGSFFLYSDDMTNFDFGTDHPFKAERAAKTRELCIRYGLMDHPWIKFIEPEPISRSLLGLFHTDEYLALLEKASDGKVDVKMLEFGLGTEDNPVIPGIFEWSSLAAGGTHEALIRICNHDALVAFHPLGGFHHAMPAQAEGFCYINDIVIAITDVLNRFPSIKIAYLDIDAHHGNGVQHAFYENSRVLNISIHETGRMLYPWSGYETEIGNHEGKGYTVNIPLEPGADDDVYAFAFDAIVPPLLQSFVPDLVVALIGADTLVSDPLTHLKLTNNAYQKVLKSIIQLCPKVLALGGGGYDLYRTARCWTLAWAILNDLEPADEFAGLVGGMMFGPEIEVGSLFDSSYSSPKDVKKSAMDEAKRVVSTIRAEVFPIHGIQEPPVS